MGTTFDRVTAARRAGEGSYDVELDTVYSMGGGPLHGGYLMATVLRAALADAPHPHPVASDFHFLRVPDPGPARVDVTWSKNGRTAAAARATLVQDDRPVIEALVSAGTLDPVADPVWLGEPPEVAPFDACVTPQAFTPDGAVPGLAAQVDVRYDPATVGWLRGRPSGRPEMRGYLRMREPQDPDPYVLALATDAMPPAVFGIGELGWAPTVQLAWHMRAVPAPGWLKLRVAARMVSDGWFDEDVEIWDAAGRLVAQARQLARVGR